MKRILITLTVVSAVFGGVVRPCAATIINLELYNTEALLNNDGLTPLQGTTSGGDLIEVLLAGADNAINGVDQFGNPGGDDTLLFAGDLRLYVGYGMPFSPNQGFLDVFPLQYDSSLSGSVVYVRFFNASSVGGATYYGNSGTFTLTAGDPYHQASWDFAPTSSLTTDQQLEFTAVPEPSNLFLFGMIFWGIRAWRKRTKSSVV